MSTTNSLRVRTEDEVNARLETLKLTHTKSSKETLAPYVQSGALTEAESLSAPTSLEDFEKATYDVYDADSDKLARTAIVLLWWYNQPFRTLVTRLLGLHSFSIRTNKGSIYRMCIVAPGTPHGGAPDPPAKTEPAVAGASPAPDPPAKTEPAGASADASTTSAAYPLLSTIQLFQFFSQNKEDKVPPFLECEFNKLLQEEVDALDGLTTSDSSSATDTNWLHAHRYTRNNTVSYHTENFCHGGGIYTQAPWVKGENENEKSSLDRRMYTQQGVSNHMMVEQILENTNNKKSIRDP